MATKGVRYRPLTPARWDDLAALFGPRGGCAGCWCMYWRLPRSLFERGKGAGNRAAFRRRAGRRPSPGILAYVDGQVAGWCAVGRRAEYPTLDRSRVLARVDDAPVWSVVCFFIAPGLRGRGISVGLLEAAVAQAARQGARVVEGYPIDPRDGAYPPAFAWTGLRTAFERAGFREVARRSDTRPIMRRVIRPHAPRPRGSSKGRPAAGR